MTQTPRQAHRVYTSVRAQPRYLGGNGKDEANVRLPARALGPTEEQGSYHSTCKEEEGSQGARLIGFLLGNLERAISPPGGMHVPGRPAALPRRSKYLGPAEAQKGEGSALRSSRQESHWRDDTGVPRHIQITVQEEKTPKPLSRGNNS